MARYCRAIMFPNLSSVLVSLIATAVPFDDGVGVMDARGNMLAWIEIKDPNADHRTLKFEETLTILGRIINDPNHATQPDWAYLKDMSP